MDDVTAVPDHSSVEVVVSGERLSVGTRTVERGRVRLRKRVTLEEQTVTVQIRREELVVEELPPRQQSGSLPPGGQGSGPVFELLLSDEQVEVVTRTVPRERVRVYVDTVTSTEVVNATLLREDVEVNVERLEP